MGGAAAVGIHDDLPAGEAGIRRRAALDETAGRVHVILCVLVQHVRGDHGLGHLLDHVLPDLLQGDIGVVLGGDDHCIHPDRAVVLVILHGDLTLAVGPHIGHLAALADLRHALAQLLCQGQGQGHQFRRLVAGVAEHHALVTGAVAQLAVGALLVLQGFVHAHGDVGGLLVDGGNHGTGVAVKAVLAPVIANVPDHLPGDVGDVHIAAGGDLAHHVDQSGAGRGLAGHAAVGVLLQNGVQDGVGDLVADLVGVALRDGFGGEEIVSCHSTGSFLSTDLIKGRKKCAFRRRNAQTDLVACSSSVDHRRIWHLVISRLPWVHRAVPSATLDKGNKIVPIILSGFSRLSIRFFRFCGEIRRPVGKLRRCSACSKIIHDFFPLIGYNGYRLYI